MKKPNPIVESLIAQTMRELSAKPQLTQQSRVWSDPEGYRYLVQWSNAVLLRYFIRLFTASLPKSEYRRKAQVDDAARSVVRNIEEGYKRQTTSEYSQFLSYSQGSLEEVKGDIRELTEDGFLPTQPGSSLATLGLDLGAFNKALKKPSSNPPLTSFKGGYGNLKEKKPAPASDADFQYHPITTLYPPLASVRADALTYEIFLELIQKTDYLLRILVVSLEKKEVRRRF